ncbi:galaxin-like [Littorina saxatilis]|uniref:galaxin-like n=1 Tax=Littorina saxatilis TaxID=31220 RepID=UPI0038B5295C
MPDAVSGDEKYDSVTHTCCDGRVKPGGRFYSCCGTEIFHNWASVCCNGTLHERGTHNGCCGNKPYNSDTHVCCGNKPYNSDTHVCCGNKPYNSDTHVCCGNKPYNSDTHVCCGNKPYNSDTHVCCGNKPYNSDTHVCCGGTIKSGVGSDTSCCGTESYNDLTHICCNGVLGKKIVDIIQKNSLAGTSSNKEPLLLVCYANESALGGEGLGLEHNWLDWPTTVVFDLVVSAGKSVLSNLRTMRDTGSSVLD